MGNTEQKRGPKPKRTGRRPGKTAPIEGWGPPPGLDGEAVLAWNHVVAILDRNGDLDRTDPVLVEVYATNVVLMREAREAVKREGLVYTAPSGTLKQSPAVAALNSASMRIKSLCYDLGLSPASSKLAADKARGGEDESKWDDLLNIVG